MLHQLRQLRFSFVWGIAITLSLAVLAGHARPAHALRIVSYNLLNYDNQHAFRDPAFRTVLSSLQSNVGNIDVIAVQEIQDQTAMTRFRAFVLDSIDTPGTWAQAQFFNDPGASFNQAIFYRTTRVAVVAADTLGNSPRDIAYYTIRPLGYSSPGAEITLFVHHFKAGSSGDDQNTRLLEAQRLRLFMNTQFADPANMIVLGDFNMRASTESAYQTLIQSQLDNTGRVQDPINLNGTWNNNSSPSYTIFHSQSTRTVNLGDGGATGGLDDRFDIILPTYPLADGVGMDQLSGTYESYGNDGLHLNLNINDPPVIPQGQAVADALQKASDHIPVILEFQVPAILSAEASLDFGTVIVGATAEEMLNVSNIAVAPADGLDYSMTVGPGFNAPFGSFSAAAGGGANSHTITMITAVAGLKNRNLTLDSDDVDNPSTLVALSGTVLRHAVPSLSAGSEATEDTLDLGTHAEGMFSDGAVSVTNLNHDSLQALLNVFDAQITGGGGRFSIVGGFSPADVGGTPAPFTITFNDTGSATGQDTTYTATLVFSTRDEQGINGAVDLSDLTVSLTATVKASSQTAVGDPVGTPVNLLGANFPNPFGSGTLIHFRLAQASRVRLEVFDVQGHRVRTMVDGWLPEGGHERVWDGISDGGGEARPGVYFYRLHTPFFSDTRRMTRLR